MSKFNQENFVLDYFDKDWADLLQIDQIDKYKLKFKTKAWITPALQKSISIKNNLPQKMITAKDPQIKERYHKEYKDYRNMLSTTLKRRKTNYYNHYFETKWNSIKNT